MIITLPISKKVDLRIDLIIKIFKQQSTQIFLKSYQDFQDIKSTKETIITFDKQIT